MKNLLKIILAALVAASAVAQQPSGQPCKTIGNHTTCSAPDSSGASLNLQSQNATSSVNIFTGGSKRLAVDGSGNISIQTGAALIPPAYVPTMAATPVAGTNMVVPGINVVPTAAANTAAFIGAATPVANQRFTVINNSGAAIRLKASGGATLNGATAGGYISVANLATVECITMPGLTNQVCMQPVIPTPAGP